MYSFQQFFFVNTNMILFQVDSIFWNVPSFFGKCKIIGIQSQIMVLYFVRDPSILEYVHSYSLIALHMAFLVQF